LIRLKYSCIERIEPDLRFEFGGVRVVFEDGAEVYGTPHTTPHYHVISHRLGYGDDLLSYCFEHEFAHLFVEERLFDRPSGVLYHLAHGKTLSGPESAYEECFAQAFQGWLRANQRPILSGVRWDELKDEALALLGG
jgi:hypothetical protein